MATAGRETGFSLKHINEHLEAQGSHLDYGNSIEIASNYMNGWYYEMIMPDSKIITANIEQALNKATELAISITARLDEIDPQKFIGYLLPNIMSPTRYTTDTRKWDNEFSVNVSCDHCQLCKKVCPVNNIAIINGQHQFGGNCQRCMACIQYCPKSAFSINGKTMDKSKYVNPKISLEEISHFNK